MIESHGYKKPDVWDKNKTENCKEANRCIKCNVENCKNHCKHDNYCALDRITIDSNKNEPKQCEAVDCKSFVEDKPKSAKKSIFSALDSVKDSFTDTFLS